MAKRQFSDFSFVDLRRGVEHDKEGEQQRDEVGVGNQPAIVIGVARAARRRLIRSSGTSAAALVMRLGKEASSFSSSMRGFIPSRMETTPSSVISRMICSSRMRIFSFPAPAAE
jgi:hypothetical protein